MYIQGFMPYDFLIFDLDGTISDPQDGFVKSLNYALNCHGFEARQPADLACHIGPPLERTLEILVGQNDASLIAALVVKYRERYNDVGYAENALYEGMDGILQTLSRRQDLHLAVCTSKPAPTARRILDMFGLLDIFEFVDGGDVGIAKGQQLAGLLANNDISKNSLMIGDRSHDLIAAHGNGLAACAVLWGYGSRQELETEKPRHIVGKPKNLCNLS